MVELEKPGFDTAAFLASGGLGRRIIQLAPKETFFTQGDPADSVFYLQEGRARVTVVSPSGKEATITLLSAGDFAGEEALLAKVGPRRVLADVVAVSDRCAHMCVALDTQSAKQTNAGARRLAEMMPGAQADRDDAAHHTARTSCRRTRAGRWCRHA